MSNAYGYRPIGDYALIGDRHSAALVSREGSIDWCCLPRFDSGSTFARLPGSERGGYCSITPTGDGDWEFTPDYLDDSLVLQTTVIGSSGQAKLLDCIVIGETAHEHSQRQIVRVIEGVRGTVEFELRVAPRFDYGEIRPWIRRHGPHLHSATSGNDALLVWSEHELEEDPRHELVTRVTLGAGQRIRLMLSYFPPERVGEDPPEPDPAALDRDLDQTLHWWQRWVKTLQLESRDEPAARRSGMVLKVMTHDPTGAIVAAPTTSLPEVPGGSRNFDYRYAWVRDSSFSSRAFAELGARETRSLRSLQGLVLVGARSRDPPGGRVHAPRAHPALGADPGRDQRGDRAPRIRPRARRLRAGVRPQGARRGAAAVADGRVSSTGATSEWCARQRRYAKGWARGRACCTATGETTACRERRVRSCAARSGWLSALVQQGEPGEAWAVFDRAVSTGNDLGLFSEEVDPTTGELLGNFPQALTHLSHISAAVSLAQAQARVT